jgi:hypothetical protein
VHQLAKAARKLIKKLAAFRIAQTFRPAEMHTDPCPQSHPGVAGVGIADF